jgi:hypothetical protein
MLSPFLTLALEGSKLLESCSTCYTSREAAPDILQEPGLTLEPIHMWCQREKFLPLLVTKPQSFSPQQVTLVSSTSTFLEAGLAPEQIQIREQKRKKHF